MSYDCLVNSASNMYYRVDKYESESVFVSPSSPALAKKIS